MEQLLKNLHSQRLHTNQILFFLFWPNIGLLFGVDKVET